MKKLHAIQKRQSGFTLVELIVVIVILGILAAVAIPKLSDSQQGAREGVQDATLGALKSAWSIVYAKNKGGAVTLAEVAKQMTEPKCGSATNPLVDAASGDTTIACDGVTLNDGTGYALFGGTSSPAAPSNIELKKKAPAAPAP